MKLSGGLPFILLVPLCSTWLRAIEEGPAADVVSRAYSMIIIYAIPWTISVFSIGVEVIRDAGRADRMNGLPLATDDAHKTEGPRVDGAHSVNSASASQAAAYPKPEELQEEHGARHEDNGWTTLISVENPSSEHATASARTVVRDTEMADVMFTGVFDANHELSKTNASENGDLGPERSSSAETLAYRLASFLKKAWSTIIERPNIVVSFASIALACSGPVKALIFEWPFAFVSTKA